MTYYEWYATFNLLNSDIKLLNKSVLKINKFQVKGKKEKFNRLLPKVQFDYMYIKELFNKLDTQSYWHQSKLNLIEWEKYKQEINMLFSQLDNILPARG